MYPGAKSFGDAVVLIRIGHVEIVYRTQDLHRRCQVVRRQRAAKAARNPRGDIGRQPYAIVALDTAYQRVGADTPIHHLVIKPVYRQREWPGVPP